MNDELGKYIINRFDHYYDTVNNKGNFFLAFNTLLLSGTIVSYKGFLDTINSDIAKCWFSIFTIIFIIFMLLSIVFVLIAIFPYLKSKSIEQKDYKSIFFFGSIATFEETEFTKKLNDLTKEKIEFDLSIQIHQLAKGLKKKFNNMKIAGWFILLELFMFIPILLILIFT